MPKKPLAPNRPPRTQGQKIEALGHFAYEVWMTAEALAALKVVREPLDGASANAFIESGIIHARNLTEFLLCKSRREDSLVPEDFTTSWVPGPAAAVQRLRSNYRPMHAYVAHLSWERVDRTLGRPQVIEILEATLDVAFIWREHLGTAASDLRLSSPFAETMDRSDQIRNGPNITGVVSTTTTSTISSWRIGQLRSSKDDA
jgi:hypothetical protein